MGDEQGVCAADTVGENQMTLPRPADISVIVPTFNERDNVEILIARLARVLDGFDWEVVFVDDDSKDGTLEVLHAAARRDVRVRYIHRIGRRGLSSAVIEGIQSTSGPLVAVMDADLQHDESLLPSMIRELDSAEVDLAVGSRYIQGGSVADWPQGRRVISKIATRFARVVTRPTLSDPMSGYFVIRRAAFDTAVRRLSALGCKILLDVLASADKPLQVKELPYTFRNRERGDSKLDALVSYEYLLLMLDKTIGRVVPVRFIMFATVGGFGVLCHMLLLALLYLVLRLGFPVAQSGATVGAMTFNFFVNNFLTYHDRRLKGFFGLARGLTSFYAVGAVGAIANVGIASALFARHYSWFLDGVAGIVVGAVWNYAASATFTWKSK